MKPMHRIPLPVDPIGVLRYTLERRQLRDELPGAIISFPEPANPLPWHLHELTQLSRHEPDVLHARTVDVLAGLCAAGAESRVWLHSDGNGFRLFYGARAHPASAVLRLGLRSRFPDATLEPLAVTDSTPNVRGGGGRACAALIGIPGRRTLAPLDAAIAGLASLPFDLIIQCRPAGETVLDRAETNLAYLAALAHGLGRVQISEAWATAVEQSVSQGVSIGLAAQETTNWSNSAGAARDAGALDKSIGTALGTILGGALAGVAGALFGLDPTPLMPIGSAFGKEIGTALGQARGDATAAQQALASAAAPPRIQMTSDQTGVSQESSFQQTRGRAEELRRGVSFECLDRQASLLAELAERFLKRLEIGRSVGMWQTSIHLVADRPDALFSIGHHLIGSLCGHGTHLDPLRLLSYPEAHRQQAVEAITKGHLPRLLAPPHPLIPWSEQAETLLTSEELATLWQPPANGVATGRTST